MKKDVTVEKSGMGKGRWSVKVNGETVAGGLTKPKARKRANGIRLGIMDAAGRCLTKEERGIKK